MALSGTHYRIEHGEHRVGVAGIGGGLRSYTVGDRAITPTYGDDVLPTKGCGAILMPWPNRLAEGAYRFDGVDQQVPITEPGPAPYLGNANHGLARWIRWTPVREMETEVVLGVDIPAQKGYPFELRAEVGYALDADGLTVTMRATNTGSTVAPFGAGAHPYLSTAGTALDDAELLVPVRERIVVDEHAIPVGVEPVDETYRLDGRPLGSRRLDTGYRGVEFTDGRARARLDTAAGSTTLWWDEAFGYAQVYTVEAMDEHGDAIAVEPMTCPADAFNSGEALIRLEPGASWSGRWGIAPG